MEVIDCYTFDKSNDLSLNSRDVLHGTCLYTVHGYREGGGQLIKLNKNSWQFRAERVNACYGIWVESFCDVGRLKCFNLWFLQYPKDWSLVLW